jgi:hypothetical protein
MNQTMALKSGGDSRDVFWVFETLGFQKPMLQKKHQQVENSFLESTNSDFGSGYRTLVL